MRNCLFPVVLSLIVAAALSAQQSTFQAQAPLVVVPVTVATGKHGQPVYGLTANDFQLLDNGQPRAFHLDPAGGYQSGISAVVIIQTSEVSTFALIKVKKVGSMVNGYVTGEGSSAAVITVDNEVHVTQDFTSDTGVLTSAFHHLQASDQKKGRAIDGVNKALDLLTTQNPKRRRIIVLISETRDRGSKAKLDGVLRRAQHENVTIWTISYSAYRISFTTRASDLQDTDGYVGYDISSPVTEPARLAKANMAGELARYTGGRHLSFARQKGLEDDLANIGKEVHTQYLLTFVPSANPPEVHRIQVEVRNHDDSVVRSRPVYWRAPNEDRSR